MLIRIEYLGQFVGWRIDCDGCGVKDEHDRGPEGQILLAHNEEREAYDSASCTECDNSPWILRVGDDDLCESCRNEGPLTADQRRIYGHLLDAAVAHEADIPVNDLLTTRLADTTPAIDALLANVLGATKLEPPQDAMKIKIQLLGSPPTVAWVLRNAARGLKVS
ncbi:MAG: hypothetical protein WC052_01355 [Patescibacteria group bacterium]